MKVTNAINIIVFTLTGVVSDDAYNQIPRLKGATPASSNSDAFYNSNIKMEEDANPTKPSLPYGEFVLTRTEIDIPEGQPQFFWQCLAGLFQVSTRMSVFTPGVPFEDVSIDTSTWEDPPNDYNATLNVNVEDSEVINHISTYDGNACSCVVQNLDFGGWISANSATDSKLAVDLFQCRPLTYLPSNWYDTTYLAPDYDTSVIEKLYDGEPLYSSTWGFVEPTILSASDSPFTWGTTNKFLRIDNPSSEWIVLKATSEASYKIEIYLIKENQFGIPPLPNQSINRAQPLHTILYTSQTSDMSKATEVELAPAPNGHYHSIVINNDEDGQKYSSSSEPPYQCSYGQYGLNTKYDVTYYIQNTSVPNTSYQIAVGHTMIAVAVSSILVVLFA